MYPALEKVEGTLGKRVVQAVQRDGSFLRGSSHRNRLVPEQASEPPLSCPGWTGTGFAPAVRCAHAEWRLGSGAPQPAPGSAPSLTLTLLLLQAPGAFPATPAEGVARSTSAAGTRLCVVLVRCELTFTFFNYSHCKGCTI